MLIYLPRVSPFTQFRLYFVICTILRYIYFKFLSPLWLDVTIFSPITIGAPSIPSLFLPRTPPEDHYKTRSKPTTNAPTQGKSVWVVRLVNTKHVLRETYKERPVIHSQLDLSTFYVRTSLLHTRQLFKSTYYRPISLPSPVPLDSCLVPVQNLFSTTPVVVTERWRPYSWTLHSLDSTSSTRSSSKLLLPSWVLEVKPVHLKLYRGFPL